jgi:hypothetical protein
MPGARHEPESRLTEAVAMVVTCAFYGFLNHSTKVILDVDLEKLEVGKVIAFEGENYVILSLFEVNGLYHANVALEQIHRARTLPRSKPVGSRGREPEGNGSQSEGRESTLQARVRAAEAQLQRLLQEREAALALLERAIQQLDRLQRGEGA